MCHKVAILPARVKDDVSAEGHGNPFGPAEMVPDGKQSWGPCTVIMQSELAGDATPPLVAMLVALSSWATVTANSCCISKHAAWWFQRNWIDFVNSCTVLTPSRSFHRGFTRVTLCLSADYSCRNANLHYMQCRFPFYKQFSLKNTIHTAVAATWTSGGDRWCDWYGRVM